MMKLFNKYDKCFNEGVEIGFCKEGEPCRGEYPHPNKIKVECLKCPYVVANAIRKELFRDEVYN